MALRSCHESSQASASTSVKEGQGHSHTWIQWQRTQLMHRVYCSRKSQLAFSVHEGKESGAFKQAIARGEHQIPETGRASSSMCHTHSCMQTPPPEATTGVSMGQAAAEATSKASTFSWSRGNQTGAHCNILTFLGAPSFSVFLWPLPWHIEAPKLGLNCSCTWAAGLHHSHSNTGSELSLWPTPQITATLDPYLTGQGQGSNLRLQRC